MPSMKRPETPDEWDELARRLQEPFDPSDVDFRPQSGGKGKMEQGARAQAVCYVDARTVAQRFDDVVGPGNWSFDFEPLIIDGGEIRLAKGTISVYGASKSDVGDDSTFSASKGCVSDTLKRTAVHWGPARYLYEQPMAFVTLGPYGKITDADLRKLRAQLPKPGQVARPVRELVIEEQTQEQLEEQQSTQKALPASSGARVPTGNYGGSVRPGAKATFDPRKAPIQDQHKMPIEADMKDAAYWSWLLKTHFHGITDFLAQATDAQAQAYLQHRTRYHDEFVAAHKPQVESPPSDEELLRPGDPTSPTVRQYEFMRAIASRRGPDGEDRRHILYYGVHAWSAKEGDKMPQIYTREDVEKAIPLLQQVHDGENTQQALVRLGLLPTEAAQTA